MLYEISIGFPDYKPLYWLNATAFFIMLKMYFIWLNCMRWAQESFHVISWTFPSTHIIGFLFKILQVDGTKLLGWAISGQHKSSAISSFSSILYCITARKRLFNVYTAAACPNLTYSCICESMKTLMDFNVPREVDIGVWFATNSSSVSKRNIWRRMSAGRYSSCALVTGHCSLSMSITCSSKCVGMRHIWMHFCAIWVTYN